MVSVDVKHHVYLLIYILILYSTAGVPLVEFMYLAFTPMPDESYLRRLS